jgi:hypothetical protein
MAFTSDINEAIGGLRSKVMVVPRVERWLWCFCKAVTNLRVWCIPGLRDKRSWIAAAQTAELPPKIRTEDGMKPVLGLEGRNGRGVRRLIPREMRVVV